MNIFTPGDPNGVTVGNDLRRFLEKQISVLQQTGGEGQAVRRGTTPDGRSFDVRIVGEDRIAIVGPKPLPVKEDKPDKKKNPRETKTKDEIEVKKLEEYKGSVWYIPNCFDYWPNLEVIGSGVVNIDGGNAIGGTSGAGHYIYTKQVIEKSLDPGSTSGAWLPRHDGKFLAVSGPSGVGWGPALQLANPSTQKSDGTMVYDKSLATQVDGPDIAFNTAQAFQLNQGSVAEGPLDFCNSSHTMSCAFMLKSNRPYAQVLLRYEYSGLVSNEVSYLIPWMALDYTKTDNQHGTFYMAPGEPLEFCPMMALWEGESVTTDHYYFNNIPIDWNGPSWPTDDTRVYTVFTDTQHNKGISAMFSGTGVFLLGSRLVACRETDLRAYSKYYPPILTHQLQLNTWYGMVFNFDIAENKVKLVLTNGTTIWYWTANMRPNLTVSASGNINMGRFCPWARFTNVSDNYKVNLGDTGEPYEYTMKEMFLECGQPIAVSRTRLYRRSLTYKEMILLSLEHFGNYYVIDDADVPRYKSYGVSVLDPATFKLPPNAPSE